MFSCIIIDDERKAREAFKKIIERYFKDQLHVLALCESVKTGVQAIHKYNPDIVFLDVEMPEENGFALFDYIREPGFEVIFTTAYQQYGVDAIKYAALDYLLKPIDYVELREALEKYQEKRNQKNRQERIDTLLSNISIGESIHQKVALPTFTGYIMETINHIIYCQADVNYTRIFTRHDNSILVSKTLKFIEELLPSDCFFRIHKTYLVNMNYITQYIKTGGHRVELENGQILEVAQRRAEEFEQVLTGKKC